MECNAIPALILYLGVLKLPESPRFLIKKGKFEEAKTVLTHIRNNQDVEKEYNEIKNTK